MVMLTASSAQVSKNLAVGVDLTYLGRPPFNQQPLCISTLAARYSTERMAAVAQLTSNARLQAAYVQRVKDNLTFGTEFSFDLASRESTGRVLSLFRACSAPSHRGKDRQCRCLAHKCD